MEKPPETSVLDASSSTPTLKATSAGEADVEALPLSLQDLKDLLQGVDACIWSLDHMGVGKLFPRRVRLQDLRDRLKREEIRRLTVSRYV